MDSATILEALVSGGVIGLILGLVGGGGSILAVPLLIYVVGVGSPHAAIGTAARVAAVRKRVIIVIVLKKGWRCFRWSGQLRVVVRRRSGASR